MSKLIASSAIVLATVIGLSACGPSTHQKQITPQQKAALAPYSALFQRDLRPQGVAGLRHKGDRHAVEAKLKSTIPPANRTAFENAFISAALHGSLTTRDGRHEFATVTVPELLQKYGAR